MLKEKTRVKRTEMDYHRTKRKRNQRNQRSEKRYNQTPTFPLQHHQYQQHRAPCAVEAHKNPPEISSPALLPALNSTRKHICEHVDQGGEGQHIKPLDIRVLIALTLNLELIRIKLTEPQFPFSFRRTERG